jgi:hypothetical protein
MTSTVVVSIPTPLPLGPGLMRLRQLCNNLRKACTALQIPDILHKLGIQTTVVRGNLLLLQLLTGSVTRIAAGGYINPLSFDTGSALLCTTHRPS